MADSAGGAWTFGGSILTFAFPMILFIVVASALYVLYTKPEYIPGHPAPGLERPVSYTPVPGPPAVSHQTPAAPAAETAPAAGTAPATAAETAPATAAETAPGITGEAAETEDAE
jgi:hypothetical protein